MNNLKVISLFIKRNRGKKRVSLDLIKKVFQKVDPTLIPQDSEYNQNLLNWLNDLQNSGLITFPKKDNLWIEDYRGALPMHINLQLEKVKEKNLKMDTPWHFILSFIPTTSISSSVVELLMKFNQYLILHNDKLQESWPIRQRSLDIFGDEKILSSFLSRGWFKKNLTLDDFGTYVPIEPFSNKMFPLVKAPRAIILENLDTFHLFCLENAKPSQNVYRYVIYGCGIQIKRQIKWISTLDSSLTTLHYFGDIDFEGFEIPNALSRTIQHFYPDISFHLAHSLYEKLNQKLPNISKEKRTSIEKLSIIKSLPNEILPNIVKVIKNHQKIPQEHLIVDDLREYLKAIHFSEESLIK